MKRPPQYVPQRTSDGDMSAQQTNPVKVGKVQAEVSDYATVYIENTQVEEALEADQLDQLLKPIAEDLCITLESELAEFMVKNAALKTGDPDQAITQWAHIAEAGALFKELGIPSGKTYAAINNFDQVALADVQTSLGVNPDVNEAWAGAVIRERFAGLNQVLTSNNLPEITLGNDLAGITLAAAPTQTYASTKDTYRMSLALTGLTATTGTITKGTNIKVTGRNMVNLRNHKVVFKSGSPVDIQFTVLEDATADGSGNATVQVSGAAIYETGVNGAFNTVKEALQSGDAIVIDGTASTTYRPALAYHEGFVGMGSVVLPKLHATDSMVMNHKGLSIRVHKFSDGVANKNRYRFDILPTFACFNPYWGQQLFGQA